jgi:hypothetical protein
MANVEDVYHVLLHHLRELIDLNFALATIIATEAKQDVQIAKQDIMITVLGNILACCQQIDQNTDQLEAQLNTVIATLNSIDGKVATEATLLTISNDVASIITEIQALNNRPELADNCSVSNIGASLTEVTLIAANTLRREVAIHNNSNGILYVICGGGATATNYNWRLRRGDHLTVDSFRGDLKGIFTNATGFAMVTEHFYT